VSIENFGRHNAHRSFQKVSARRDSAEMKQSDHQPNRAVPAHSEIASVIEKNRAGHTAIVHRRAKKRTDDNIRTSRLVDYRAAEVIILCLESLSPQDETSLAQIRTACDDHPSWLTASVGVNNLD
jgi:hypothetical protein